VQPASCVDYYHVHPPGNRRFDTIISDRARITIGIGGDNWDVNALAPNL